MLIYRIFFGHLKDAYDDGLGIAIDVVPLCPCKSEPVRYY